MSKYRKKPVVIEAVQLTEEMARAYFWEEAPGPFGLTIYGTHNPRQQRIDCAYVTIDTLEGRMRADIGDWIIRGVQGELYPCKPDIFEQTYEAVE